MKRLFRKDKKGNLLFWEVSVSKEKIIINYGHVGGKVKQDIKIALPKNIGKSNETSAEEQAIKEAKALWDAKLTRKYSETVEDANEEVLLPMLAKSWKNEDIYPADAQPKMDGVRSLAKKEKGKVTLLSRNGREYENVKHINIFLENVMQDGDILDGELYLHGHSFQEVIKLIKKERDESKDIKFWIYDFPRSKNHDCTEWKDRKERLKAFFENIDIEKSPLVEVETTRVHNEGDIIKLKESYEKKNFEGLILRTDDHKYLFSHRSSGLLKVKSFDDDEFMIIGFKEGKGRLKGTPIWICKTSSSDQFEVTPKGKIEDRKKLFKTAGDFKGKMLKVSYFGLTDSGIPRFPIGLGIRDPIDI